VGYLNINREKMSKSLGNVLNVREMRQKVDPMVIRFFLLSAHYRSPLNFTPEQLEQSQRALERLNILAYNLEERLPRLEEGLPDREEEALLALLAASRERFVEVMDDDFNTAEGLAVLFTLARDANIYLNRGQGQKANILRPLRDFYREADGIFNFSRAASDVSLEDEIAALVTRRDEARRRKDWAEADGIRNELRQRGIILEDTAAGVRWRFADTPL
jgi:cysteinyl-tRNA synthetase